MKSKLVLSAAMVAGMAFASAPSHAAGAPIVSFPAAAQTGNFGLPQTIVQEGEEVTYVNLDPTASHNVRSVRKDKVKRPWCSTAQALAGNCPIFHLKDLVDAGGQATVPGTDALAPGDYEFYCEPHDNMVGTLTII